MKPFAVMFLAFWSICFHLIFTSNLVWFQPCRAASSALGNETDHLGLLKFKESISNDPYGVLDSWNASTHFCNWHGITCSPRHQRVTELRLDGYHLRGFISPYVGNLSFLRSIILWNNSFSGQIPQELGRLFRLQALYLNNNALTGEIPINLTSCYQVRYLNLNGNNLIGSIPMEIGSLQKLEELYFAKNNLTGRIPASMWNISSLAVIFMNYNKLEGNLSEEIGLLKNLEIFEVGANNLSGTIPSSLYNVSSLTNLVVTLNQFNGSLPPNIFLTLPNLQMLEIGGNQISGPFPISLANASVLQTLDASENHFVGQFRILGKLQNLRMLDISESSLGSSSSGDLGFLNFLTNCSKLHILDIGYNNFGGHLPDFIGNLSTQLIELYLGGNQITGEIPTTLGNLVNLIGLGMEYNHLTGIIPSSFEKFEKMQELLLDLNKLSGQIPAYIGNLNQLYVLDLASNLFEAEIPPSIGNCQNLKTLHLQENKLSGAIPSQIFSIFSLSFLRLSHNSLSGTLPAEVGNLKNIKALDVSKNYLSSDIPETIGYCLSLEYLSLRGNSFDETIPSSLASLKSLQYLDLSQNNLSGSIPEGLQGISVLEYLNVSFNMLDGMVPNKGVFSNASAISVTGNNKLCGGIFELQLPPCPVKVTRRRKHHHFKLIMVISCVTTFLLLVSSILVIYQIRRRNKKSFSNSPAIDHLSKVSYQSLHHATNGFSDSDLVGSGGFGSVYRGSIESIESEEVVAIKVLNLQKKGAHKSFLAECNALKNIRHRNLVKILTCCSSTDYKGNDFKALVFEYMANGSLEKWLHPVTENAECPTNFLLDQRLYIIIDVASALHYLHYECEQPVIHCDLKPSNVLLDGDMVAHLSDFGLARLLSNINSFSNKQTSSIGIKGTIGYAPPEYGMSFDVSTEGDVYSFGILVLELLTGIRPTEAMFKDGHNLHNYVQVAFPDKLLQIVDQTIFPRGSKQVVAAAGGHLENLTLINPNVEKCLISLFRIGIACSMDSPKERMSMADVTRELNLIRNSFLSGRINKD